MNSGNEEARWTIQPGHLTLAQLRDFYRAPAPIQLDAASDRLISASAETVQNVLRSGQTVYGVNTGFGLLANRRIGPDDLQQLQVNLVMSHSAGVGPLLDDAVVRLLMLLKVNSLARGYSGVRRMVVDVLIELLNADLLPCVPAKGSVGASGDLAPLAHLSGALIGMGRMRADDDIIDAGEGLRRIGRQPLTLAPKEGLALLNGTQVSTALALAGLFEAEKVMAAAIVAGAMSVDAALASDVPFDPRLHQVRGHLGQIQSAAAFRRLLQGSQIRESHRNCPRVQDPYSLRCQPQVMGACLDLFRHAARTLQIEANSVSDNPIVFSRDGVILSGGNFHAEPVALAADMAAIALAEIGTLSERRIALLVDGNLSQLPPFLVADGGLHSGFMIAQVTAAALASENKLLAHPASIDNIPTSANQEDHVSMATFAARRLAEMANNAAAIVGIELLAACQGIDLRKPLQTSPLLVEVHQRIRQIVPYYDADRRLQPDIDAATDLVRDGYFLKSEFAVPTIDPEKEV